MATESIKWDIPTLGHMALCKFLRRSHIENHGALVEEGHQLVLGEFGAIREDGAEDEHCDSDAHAPDDQGASFH